MTRGAECIFPIDKPALSATSLTQYHLGSIPFETINPFFHRACLGTYILIALTNSSGLRCQYVHTSDHSISPL